MQLTPFNPATVNDKTAVYTLKSQMTLLTTEEKDCIRLQVLDVYLLKITKTE